MKDIYEKLSSILLLEKEILSLLKQSFQDEKQALVKFDVDTLNHINERKSRLIEKIAMIEERKERILGELSVHNYGKEELINIESAVFLMNEGSDRDTLTELVMQIEHIASEVKMIGHENKRLAKHALKTVEVALKSITTGGGKADHSYSRSGKEKQFVTPGSIIEGSL